MKKKLFFLLVILFAAHSLLRIYEYRQAYLTPFDAAYWKQRFENSQWSTKPACEMLDPHYNPYTCIWDDKWYEEHKNDKNAQYLKRNTIGDDGVYTYAGWEYIHGKDPTTLNAELPPFGKYLIGLSEIIFQNQNIFALISGIFALIAMYFFTWQIFKNKLLAFLPVILFSFEPLFYSQLQAPFLDLLYLGLLLMTLTFFLRKQFVIAGVFLGLMAATKAPASTYVLVVGVVLLYVIITKQFRQIKKFVLFLLFSILSFLLTYLQYFINGNTLIDFLKVQKWIINFYADGAKGSVTAPWELFFTGHYANWWGGQTVVSEWHLGWPLMLIVSFFAFYQIRTHIQKTSITLVCLWTGIYLVFLSVVPLWSRYLLLLLPFMYILIIWVVTKKLKIHED